jgi:exodeoxyribonuclease-3
VKIATWNVNGLRAILKRGFAEAAAAIGADVLCLQETKANEAQVLEALSGVLPGWTRAVHSAVRPGYSGTCVLSREAPLSVARGLGEEGEDDEGRVLALEFAEFFVVDVYVPNSGQELKRLDYRTRWDAALRRRLARLAERKPVVVCGDFNVAHEAIDLARPEANYDKSAGYTQKEIDGMDALLASGFADTFRRLHPEARGAYSWWSYRMNARARNVGWRIDYVLAGESLFPRVKEAFLLPDITGSDHCPAGIVLE